MNRVIGKIDPEPGLLRYDQQTNKFVIMNKNGHEDTIKYYTNKDDENMDKTYIKLPQGFIFDLESINYVKLPYEVKTENETSWILEIGFNSGKANVKIPHETVQKAMQAYKLVDMLLREYITGVTVFSKDDLTQEDMRKVRQG